jgi:hypothetical protein
MTPITFDHPPRMHREAGRDGTLRAVFLVRSMAEDRGAR